MKDILPHVAGLLAETGAQIELSWRDTYVTFPLIVLSVPSNTATACGGDEVFTRITVQADAYTPDKLSTMLLAKAIDEIMTANGFTRILAQPFTESGLERYLMQFSCVLDYTHERILI